MLPEFVNLLTQAALFGLSLSLDAFAVSVSSGVSIKGLRPFDIIRAAFFFGLFQFLMPVIGFFVGKAFIVYIKTYDHWIAFGLLAFIGAKMLRDALRCQTPSDSVEAHNAGADNADSPDIRGLGTLLVLALATSIDALAVGVSFSVTASGIWLSAALIGGITFIVCLTGFEFGKRIGHLFEKWAQIAGGIILIALGVKILIEHLFGAS
jgi:putative Mn2+ efflux pump MntP